MDRFTATVDLLLSSERPDGMSDMALLDRIATQVKASIGNPFGVIDSVSVWVAPVDTPDWFIDPEY